MGWLRTFAFAFGAIALAVTAHLFLPSNVALVLDCGVMCSLVAKDAQTRGKLQRYRKLFADTRAAAVDSTDRKKLEAQLRHAQKMDAVGQLAGGVAHDFNNMLSVILGFSYALLEDTPEGSDAFVPLTEIKRAAERSADLTKQLLAFSRQKPERTNIVDMNDLVRGTDGLVRRLVGAKIAIATRLTPNTCCVEVDETQLEQVIMNLAVNARDAMPSGGTLTIETRVVENEIVLAVSDTGVGMDAATQSRIFEPFFTTKGTGKGTGLGLSIVFAIVRQHGGRVTVESEEGRGTTFLVHLPARHKRPAATLTQTHVPSSVRGDETILVVDDEEQVLQVTARVLQRNGYRVLTARHPGEALVLSEKFHEPIDLLITDVMMPQMNGRELAERLVATRSHLKVIYTSGFTNDVDTSTGSAFLQKPVTPQDLGRKVREVLGPAQTRAA